MPATAGSLVSDDCDARKKSIDRDENWQGAKVFIPLNSTRIARMEGMDVDDRDSLLDIEVSNSPRPSRSTNIYGSPVAGHVKRDDSGESIASTSNICRFSFGGFQLSGKEWNNFL